MCMIDNDNRVTRVNGGEYRVARKEHKCMECRRAIPVGERYHYETFIGDGHFTQHKTCQHCMIVRGWLNAECGGWIYTRVHEDIAEHADDGHYGFWVKLLSIGMERKWKRQDGSAWPLPRMPKVSQGVAA